MNIIPNWDEYFMAYLPVVAMRSKDKHTQVGCVIVGQDNSVRSTGYNSFPRGVNDNVEERYERPEKYKWLSHSERNAIFAAAKVGVPLDKCKLYVSIMPCMDCAVAIVQVGISEVVIDAVRQEGYAASDSAKLKYGPDFERVEQLFKEAGVKLTGWRKDATT